MMASVRVSGGLVGRIYISGWLFGSVMVCAGLVGRVGLGVDCQVGLGVD
jgi:hypothetical protein